MDGGIKFDVSANTAKFQADMGRVKNSASSTANAVGKAFSGLGSLFVGGALVAGLNTLLRKMDNVSDMARRFGTTAVEIQKVGNAAEIVGTNVDAVARAMNKAGVAANKAAREGGSLAEAFARVDINPAKFAAAGLEERIKMVAKAQVAANGDAQKMADLFEVIGVKAAGINFAELVSEMDLVNAASNETVEALAAANDQLDKMKQNATIFGANLVKGIVDASERLGNLFAGGSGKTNAEIDQEQARLNAEARLKVRGELLPDDSTVVTKKQFVLGPVPSTGQFVDRQESIPGPNAEENIRRINAEMEKMRAETEAAATATTIIEDATAETLDKTSGLAEVKREMADIDLQIKEAQAAGNDALAADLSEYKDLVEAAIKYEGDLDKAAREVNATHEEGIRLQQEKNRLKEEEIAKQHASIEAELKHVETMAFGTEEARKKAEWMDEYNRRMGDGATDDQARRFADAATYDEPSQDYGGSRSGGGGTYSPIGPSTDSAMSENERVADLRGRARQAPADRRASELAGRGMYRSAIRAQDRGQRAYDRAMESARIRDQASKYDFGNRKAANAGEAFDTFRRNQTVDTRGAIESSLNFDGKEYDTSKSEQENFKRMLAEDAKTPEERKAEQEEQRAKHAPPGGMGAPEDKSAESVLDRLDKIIKHMETRLPIRVLSAA